MAEIILCNTSKVPSFSKFQSVFFAGKQITSAKPVCMYGPKNCGGDALLTSKQRTQLYNFAHVMQSDFSQ